MVWQAYQERAELYAVVSISPCDVFVWHHNSVLPVKGITKEGCCCFVSAPSLYETPSLERCLFASLLAYVDHIRMLMAYVRIQKIKSKPPLKCAKTGHGSCS